MKSFSDECIAALESGEVIDVGAVAIYCQPAPVLVWGGYGEIVLAGETYKGIGDRGLVNASGSAIGGQTQNLTLELSGIDPDVLAVFDATTLRDVPVKVWRLIFDSSGTTLLNGSIYARGRLDQVPREDAEDGTATLKALIETAAMGLGRKSGRRLSDADQRLISATDGSMKAISYAPTKQLAWGGKIPEVVGSAVK